MIESKFFYILLYITPIVVYLSLYKPKKAAIGMSIAALALVTGTVVPNYPPLIKNFLLGYLLVVLVYHIFAWCLLRFRKSGHSD
jgi:hypothetical protein